MAEESDDGEAFPVHAYEKHIENVGKDARVEYDTRCAEKVAGLTEADVSARWRGARRRARALERECGGEICTRTSGDTFC